MEKQTPRPSLRAHRPPRLPRPHRLYPHLPYPEHLPESSL